MAATLRMGLDVMAYYANDASRNPAMPTRNVVLTAHQASYVERLVASGQYQNASEVLREGLRLVEQRETEASARLAALKQAAGAGIADFEAGRFRSFDSPTALADHLASLTAEVLGSA